MQVTRKLLSEGIVLRHSNSNQFNGNFRIQISTTPKWWMSIIHLLRNNKEKDYSQIGNFNEGDLRRFLYYFF